MARKTKTGKQPDALSSRSGKISRLPADGGKRSGASRDHLFLFFGFVLYILMPALQVRTLLDFNLMPRTILLSVFLVIAAFWAFRAGYLTGPISAVLRKAVFPVLLGYLLVSLAALVGASVYQEGIYDIIKTVFLLLVTALAALVLADRDDWADRLAFFALIAACIHLSVGFYQYATIVLPSKVQYTADGYNIIYQVKGLMLHKNEFSNALLLLMPFLAYGIYRFKGLWRWLFMGVMGALLVMVVLLKTRAVWLAIVLALFIAAVVLVLRSARFGIRPMYRNALATLLVGGVLGLGWIFSIDAPEDPYSIISRIQSVGDFGSRDNIWRLRVWQGTADMIRDNPVLGVGPGNWRLAYYPYVKGVFDNIQQVNWAQPHNDFLWIFAEKGIGGILLYLSFFGLLFSAVWQVIARADRYEHRMMALLIGAGLVGFLVISFFSFPYDRVDHMVALGIMGAGLLAMQHRLRAGEPLRVRPIYLLAPVGLWMAFALYYGIRGARQERHLAATNRAEARKQYDVMIAEASKSRNPLRLIDPNSRHLGEYIALAYDQKGQPDKSLEAIEEALSVFPGSMSLQGLKGHYLSQLGRHEEALVYFEKALEIVPQSKELLSNCGAAYFNLGQYEKALETQRRIPNKEQYPDVMERIGIMKRMLEAQQQKQ
jgi:O-antigen ligase